MKIPMLALCAALALSAASFANAMAEPYAKAPGRRHAPRAVVTVHPDPRGGWGGPEWYTKGWGGWGWGYGPGQGLLAGALISGGLTAPYYDFTFGYPPSRRPWGYPYVAFPYGIGYPYYNISYGYYRPPLH
jgi:glycine/D-amino acid oxidase-like deaminating enzyme